MSLTVIITQTPDSPGSQQARSYCLAHQADIVLIFFFDQGVRQALSNNDHFWQTLEAQHNITLCCCTDSVKRHLGINPNITAPFIVSGMGKLAQACDQTTQTILF